MRKLISMSTCAILIIAGLGFTSCEKKDEMSINSKEKMEKLQLPNEKNNFINISLYFDSSKGDGNEHEISKEERLINKEEFIGEVIIQELIKGPSVKSELQPILPKDTRLLSFSIKDGIAYINFSKDAKVKMSTSKERACLSSIVSSLSQLPSVTKVQILIESINTDTLGGNYNISKPFTKSDIERFKIK